MRLHEIISEGPIKAKAGSGVDTSTAKGVKKASKYKAVKMGPARMGRMGGSGHAIGRSIASGGKGASSSTLSAIGRSMRL